MSNLGFTGTEINSLEQKKEKYSSSHLNDKLVYCVIFHGKVYIVYIVYIVGQGAEDKKRE